MIFPITLACIITENTPFARRSGCGMCVITPNICSLDVPLDADSGMNWRAEQGSKKKSLPLLTLFYRSKIPTRK